MIWDWLRRKPQVWVHCRKCSAHMAWRRSSVNSGFDRVTGRPAESFWDVWACPEWRYETGNGHDFSWGEYRVDVPVA